MVFLQPIWTNMIVKFGVWKWVTPLKIAHGTQKIKVWFRCFSFSRLDDFQVPAVDFFGENSPRFPKGFPYKKGIPDIPPQLTRPPWIHHPWRLWPKLKVLGFVRPLAHCCGKHHRSWCLGWLVGWSVGRSVGWLVGCCCGGGFEKSC